MKLLVVNNTEVICMGKHIRTGNAKVIVIKYKSTCVETQLSVFEQ